MIPPTWTSLGRATTELNAAGFLLGLLHGTFPAVLLPALCLAVAMTVSFATGTSFGTFAVLLPALLPLAHQIDPDPDFARLCLGAVVGGAVFGDQCSPVSDTTILTSMFTGCDLMDHVRTQLPVGLAAAAVAGAAATALAA